MPSTNPGFSQLHTDCLVRYPACRPRQRPRRGNGSAQATINPEAKIKRLWDNPFLVDEEGGKRI
ncbi:hypothetical protein OG245_37680 (plasmid) [Streptomyces sp. NBC_01116]|uniref:hypothetical protein n=1 Tax=Streptomyces sp. NBC_01116 TaxID=2903752 RepID=UPI002F90B12E